MSRRLILSCFVTCLAAGALPSRADEAPLAVKGRNLSIARIETGWAQAIVERNTRWFEHTLAADWRIVLPGGKVWEKTEFLDALGSARLIIEQYRVLEVEPRIYGETAVVIGRGEVRGKTELGPFENEERWTSVYVRQDGHWRCVSTHVGIAK